jgi:hypothetical protein
LCKTGFLLSTGFFTHYYYGTLLTTVENIAHS